MVNCWGLWPIHICVVIDHFSRKVMAAVPLEGPDAGWINNALESAIEKYGPPKHFISDQGSVFIGSVFAELLSKYNIKPRLGVGSWEPSANTDPSLSQKESIRL